MSIRHAMQACPGCGAEIDAATYAGPGEKAPKVGDLSVCFYCAAALEYGPGLALQLVDIDTLPIEDRVNLRHVVQQVRGRLWK